MRVSAIVISHGHADELEQSLPALLPQVDELLLIVNPIPNSVPSDLPDGVRVLRNEQVLSFAANANVGTAHTQHELVLIANPDAIPAPNAVAVLREFMEAHPRCGVAGPKMLYGDGSWQASRRSFPTVGATLVRRTPLRLLFDPLRWQRRHYLLDERPDEPARADTMLGAFLLMRRTMLDEIDGWDPGYRMYCEDIDLNYRAAKAGWERWYVPAAVVRHEYAAVIDKRFLTRHTIWHARAMLRFLRKHPERLLALR
ncbi:MAG TPA: glycosyltransferase family 2 protein [Gaiellaceae bacterium]|nr:glycosyltransferase family 2 protein [Gaiellaceae bacterium]